MFKSNFKLRDSSRSGELQILFSKKTRKSEFRKIFCSLCQFSELTPTHTDSQSRRREPVLTKTNKILKNFQNYLKNFFGKLQIPNFSKEGKIRLNNWLGLYYAGSKQPIQQTVPKNSFQNSPRTERIISNRRGGPSNH